MRTRMKRPNMKHDDERKHRWCDPGQCRCCEDRGNGDFFCRYLKVTVVHGWHNTENHLLCKRKDRKGAGDNGRNQRKVG